MLLCVLALSHFSITSTADVAPLLREALYDEVYVRLHGAEAARKLLELVPVLESAYTTELRRHPFLAAARRSPLDNSTKKANIGRIASLMSMRAGLLELRSWASPGETADPANRTTRAHELGDRIRAVCCSLCQRQLGRCEAGVDRRRGGRVRGARCVSTGSCGVHDFD